ncbi:peptidoglycan DD-metalloendopeptidase family protein [Microbacterium sp. NPDC089320]|uniref:peptidoglycan DD-metalloendopeptidase family protein n=1 Tax=Microbacterium sp. NPDC089320 TaxID=3155182 RepID=UPI003430070E
MPFENPQAASAPTRRSSRPRTAAFEASAAGVTEAVSEAASVSEAPSVPFEAPTSRRAARQRLNTAEVFIAATAVAAASAASDSADVVAVEPAEAPAEVDEPIAAEPTAAPAAEPAASAQDAPEAPRPEDGENGSRRPSAHDAFETAARAFRHVAPAAMSQPATETDAPAAAAAEMPAEHIARRRPSARKFLAVGATVGVMSLAGLLAVGMTLPAEAVAAVQGTPTLASTSLVAASGSASKAASNDEIQAFVTSSDVQNESLARSDSFSSVSLIQVASEEGINYSNEVFTNDAEAAIQWPFKVGVGMSSGYGMRWGRLHEGIDFVPGEGAPIQAIADGVVRIATEQGNAYGVTVYIDHVIDGQVITSHYSHMQYGSLQVKAGQTVKVGDIVGHTGNTGRSYGAHLHFEIIINGSTIDPLPWLRENAGRMSY